MTEPKKAPGAAFIEEDAARMRTREGYMESIRAYDRMFAQAMGPEHLEILKGDGAMSERKNGFIVRDAQGNTVGSAFQGLRTWLPGPDSGPAFGLDRSGGIRRKFRPCSRWQRFRSWLHRLFREPGCD